MTQERPVSSGTRVLDPDAFNFIYSRFSHQIVPLHRVEDTTGTVLSHGFEVMTIDYSEEPGTKLGKSSRKDQRVLILRFHKKGDSEAEDEDARHEIYIGADGTLLQLGGLDPLSQEDAAELADDSLFDVLRMIQNLGL